ncbi:MAG: NAD(+) synthase, partial [Oscillospiraceae bacterium]|nr:NAD(+) synthase [Oscillospiraceae bacterium]
MFDLQKMGYVRMGAAVPDVQVANPQANVSELLRWIRDAEQSSVNVLVFPELCLTGYTCADLFHQRLLLESTQEALSTLLQATQKSDMVLMVGAPVELDNQLFNCAVALHRGKILGVVPK